jgi:hypothetical protein
MVVSAPAACEAMLERRSRHDEIWLGLGTVGEAERITVRQPGRTHSVRVVTVTGHSLLRPGTSQKCQKLKSTQTEVNSNCLGRFLCLDCRQPRLTARDERLIARMLVQWD